MFSTDDTETPFVLDINQQPQQQFYGGNSGLASSTSDIDFFPSSFGEEQGQAQGFAGDGYSVQIPQQAQLSGNIQPAAPSSGGGWFGGSGGSSANNGQLPEGYYPQDPENEPPLMVELGIDPARILGKTLNSINPFKSAAAMEESAHFRDDPDLAGPLIYFILFGIVLLLSGKMQFGYIYGLALISSTFMWVLVNLMNKTDVAFSPVMSILGYSMLPILILATFTIFIPSSWITFRFLLALVAIFVCTFSSSGIFVNVFNMVDQRALVAYPIGIIYTCFSLLTIF